MEGARNLLLKLVKVEKQEVAALLWSAAYFFFLLAAYYIIRPVREEMGILSGVERLPDLYLGSWAAMILINPVYNMVVANYPRRKFLPYVYLFFLSNLILFYLIFISQPPEESVVVVRAFYVWTSVFGLFAVSVFWGFMADLYRQEQGKRLFAIILFGGNCGALLGSQITESLVQNIGPANLLLIAIGLLIGCLVCIKSLVRVFHLKPEQGEEPAKTDIQEQSKAPSFLSGAVLLFRSPYMLGICLFTLFYTLTSTFLYFEQARVIKEALEDSAERTALFAAMNKWATIIGMVFQAFLTARVIQGIGVGLTLAILPFVTFLGFGALGMAPILTVMVISQVVRRAAHFSFSKPAREILFTVVPQEEKYKSKTYIDTFIYRAGDASAGLMYRGLGMAQLGLAKLALIMAPVAVVWTAVALILGRRQKKLAREDRREG